MNEQDVLNNNYQRSLEQREPFILLRPSLFVDGNQWCALYGEDLQRGVAGFGDTPEAAAADFNKNWICQRVTNKRADTALESTVELCRYTSKPLSECDCPEGCKSNQIGAGEWVQPEDNGYRMECCECGLIHVLNFRIHEGKIQFQAFRLDVNEGV